MPQAVLHFPAGFLWGTATASQQVEGANANNNWAAWEQTPGHIHNDERAGLACDWWGGRWKEDFDRAAETGQNAHRLSIEWSRVQPTPDRWDEHALDVYREMLRGLISRNMTPLVTLHHFSDPLWLVERGGWENDETPALFAAYTAKVVEALKEYANLWVTINEPNVYTYSGWLNGDFPPGKNDMGLAFKVLANLLRAHAAGYAVIHRLQPQARVGVAHHLRGFVPARPGFAPDGWMASILSNNFNFAFPNALTTGKLNFAFRSAAVPEARGTQDFLGINYYTAEQVTFAPLAFKDFFTRRAYDPAAPLSETGFIASVPNQFFRFLKWAKGFNLPILITENGAEDSRDHFRPAYLAEHIHQVWRGINFNWPIKGYFVWSLVDNFEWERGWSQRFGLWGLDTATQARIRRPSVDLYAAVCKENALSSAVVEKYAPQALPRIFPG